MDRDSLVAAARAARTRAYAPYSQYQVGAALLTVDGHIVTGVNVENASYGLTQCAERTALGTAVTLGHRQFRALAVVTQDGAACCGACRQALREFGETWEIFLACPSGPARRVTLEDLLPESFGPENLSTAPPE